MSPQISAATYVAEPAHRRLLISPRLRPQAGTGVPALAASRFRQIAPLLVLPAAFGTIIYAAWLPLLPDASYYVRGVGLFPSPLGTLVGAAGGYTGLAAFNAAAAFAVVLLVALLAVQLGGRPIFAQVLALLIVPATWFQHSVMDSPGVALLLAAALLELRGRSRSALIVAGIAVATHLAALPLAVGAILAHRSRRRVAWIAIGLAVAGATVGALTTYQAGFQVLSDPHAFLEGAHELLLACWPVLLLSPIAAIDRRARFLFYGFASGAILAGAIPASVGQAGGTRYAVPCLFVAAAALRLRRAPALPHGL